MVTINELESQSQVKFALKATAYQTSNSAFIQSLWSRNDHMLSFLFLGFYFVSADVDHTWIKGHFLKIIVNNQHSCKHMSLW